MGGLIGLGFLVLLPASPVVEPQQKAAVSLEGTWQKGDDENTATIIHIHGRHISLVCKGEHIRMEFSGEYAVSPKDKSLVYGAFSGGEYVVVPDHWYYYDPVPFTFMFTLDNGCLKIQKYSCVVMTVEGKSCVEGSYRHLSSEKRTGPKKTAPEDADR